MAEIRKATLFTNEYPPNVYGGAGVHVEYLSQALARRIAVEVRCFGDQRIDRSNLTVRGYPRWAEAKEHADAIVAVSEQTRDDVLRLFDVQPARVHVIHNGIDPAEYRPTGATDALVRYGVDPARPYVLFVGRITRQKGIIHLVDALPEIDPGLQIVLCAGAPDTPEIGREMETHVAAATAQRRGVVWIREMLPRAEVIQLYEHAAVFCCPSVYEPFGIINLEAMACETAVVASRVGGIPEVVVPEETGLLIDLALSPRTFQP